MYLKTDGLVLREVPYNDTDKLLTVLTRDHGKMTLRARGVNRKKSQLVPACQLLAFSEFTVFENRGFHTINEAQTKTMFLGLRSDLELLSLASYFAQVAEVLSQEDFPNPQLLSLTLNAMYALETLKKPQLLVKAAFELRAACLAGYTPQLSGCAVCGNTAPDRFNVRHGILQCAACQSADMDGLRMPVDQGLLMAMHYVVLSEASRLFSFSLSDEALRCLSELTETYLATQLERGFYTLDFYKSLFL